MILVTGCGGFIGFHLSLSLLNEGKSVVGVDNLNEYYDPTLKNARLSQLTGHNNFTFYKYDICDYPALEEVFKRHKIDIVCHLAAQAGVRYSLTHPFAYQKSNNEGFLNIIELARHYSVKNFVYASSSSVYGNNKKLPFSETDRVDEPLSLYAATKRSNELTAYSYSSLYKIPCSGLRFFTVYGPWGRPDMALFIFTKAILAGRPIQVFNHGRMLRNFTFIDDIVDGIIRVMNTPKPYELYNIGNNKAENLMDFIHEIERVAGKSAQIEYLPLQAGDVPETKADIGKIQSLGYSPKTDINIGIEKFCKWYKEYYRPN